MRTDSNHTPGIDAFWELADVEESDEHPLERELLHHLDAMTRYGLLIADAHANGQDAIAEQLQHQLAREEMLAREIREALRRCR